MTVNSTYGDESHAILSRNLSTQIILKWKQQIDIFTALEVRHNSIRVVWLAILEANLREKGLIGFVGFLFLHVAFLSHFEKGKGKQGLLALPFQNKTNSLFLQ